jgi:chemotaxis protein CheD
MVRPMADVVIHPGQWFFGRGQRRVQTLLGSCVAATFWHAAQRLGGMCHYVLPHRGADVSTPVPDGRYGTEVLDVIHRMMRRAGTRPVEYEVNLFGGGNMFPGMASSTKALVGDKNVAAGRRLLQDLGFVISSEHVAGTGYRVVELDVGTGQIDVRYHGVRDREEGGHG